MASTYAPPLSRRSPAVAYGGRAWQHSSYPLLLVVAAGVFVVSALALLLSQSGFMSRSSAVTAPAAVSSTGSTGSAVAAPKLTPAEIETVVSYARAMRADDALVQVRPGVFAKRSSVHGVPVNGATVYYDILPHQSYGPLRSGELTEQQINVISREAQNGFMVVVYTKK
jgi:hypothetical protein